MTHIGKFLLQLSLVTMLLQGCTSNSLDQGEEPLIDNNLLQASEVSQPDGWNEELALTIPVDINPDPNILK